MPTGFSFLNKEVATFLDRTMTLRSITMSRSLRKTSVPGSEIHVGDDLIVRLNAVYLEVSEFVAVAHNGGAVHLAGDAVDFREVIFQIGNVLVRQF